MFRLNKLLTKCEWGWTQDDFVASDDFWHCIIDFVPDSDIISAAFAVDFQAKHLASEHSIINWDDLILLRHQYILIRGCRCRLDVRHRIEESHCESSKVHLIALVWRCRQLDVQILNKGASRWLENESRSLGHLELSLMRVSVRIEEHRFISTNRENHRGSLLHQLPEINCLIKRVMLKQTWLEHSDLRFITYSAISADKEEAIIVWKVSLQRLLQLQNIQVQSLQQLNVVQILVIVFFDLRYFIANLGKEEGV